MRYFDKKRSLQILGVLSAAIVVLVCGFAEAGQLTIPNTFTSNTTISSSQMNANFSAVETANDDNDARISTLEGRKITVLSFTYGNYSNQSPTTWTQNTYMTPYNLAFTKNSSTSKLIVTWNDTLMGHSLNGSLGYCMWDMRIDGVANSVPHISWPLYSTSDTGLPISVTAIYTGFAAGAHNVQLWLKTTNTACFNNVGNWARNITVQEVP